VDREEEIPKALEYIRNIVGQLDVAETLPSEVECRELLVNRAMDVRSACMAYLGTQLHHQANRLGIIGNLRNPSNLTFRTSFENHGRW
jgi:hypothetical protein